MIRAIMAAAVFLFIKTPCCSVSPLRPPEIIQNNSENEASQFILELLMNKRLQYSMTWHRSLLVDVCRTLLIETCFCCVGISIHSHTEYFKTFSIFILSCGSHWHTRRPPTPTTWPPSQNMCTCHFQVSVRVSDCVVPSSTGTIGH